jgi:hypothetical protein
MISRAADFGNIAQLLEAKAPILRLRAKCQEAKNSLEALLHSAILAHLGEIAAAKEYFFVYKSFKKKEGMYYCSPLLSPLSIRLPMLVKLAASPLSQMSFESEALQESLAFWLEEKCELKA